MELYVARPIYQQLIGGVTSKSSASEQAFRIDSISGQIFTTGFGIDHETLSSYHLVVSAHDDGFKFHGGVTNTVRIKFLTKLQFSFRNLLTINFFMFFWSTFYF